jgi:DNA repair protein RecN (Recombination protein N)
MASVRELSELVGSTIDLCGQHEHQRLLDPATHVELLDAWGGEELARDRMAWQEALAAARAARKELERVRVLTREADERLDEASFVLRRIDETGPSLEEFEELERTLPRAEHAESLMRSVGAAHEALSAEGGACEALADAIDHLRDASAYDSALDAPSERLDSLLIDLEDVASDLRGYRDGIELDPEELARMQARMNAMQGLLRAYGPSMRDVLARREQAQELVQAAHDGGQREREAQHAWEQAEERLALAADRLEAARMRVAPDLARAVSEQMSFLQMGSAELSVHIERLPRAKWTVAGPSRVELLYRPGAGLTARPLRRIASGGEVSRVMLACKVVLGDADGTETLVFDEVDAGVGGATAVALAQVLARLARTHQVIVVTHLAQVAVVGERHYLVSKSEGDTPQTSLVEIEGARREQEIARMLSGDSSELSLAHARQMLQEARA